MKKERLFNLKELSLKGLFLKQKNYYTFRSFFNSLFNIYSFRNKSNILKLVAHNISFYNLVESSKRKQVNIRFIKDKNLNFKILEQNKRQNFNKNLKENINSSFSKKKNYFKTTYSSYLLNLNGNLAFKPFKSSNYLLNLLPSVKFIFKNYYKLIKIKEAKRILKKDYYDINPLINILKIKQKFQYISKDLLRGCRIYFKYTGSNIFGTITNNIGEVVFSYSAGIFKHVKTRKEKTTIFIAKQLGELIALRLYRSNATEISFIPLMNHRKARSLMKFLGSGFRLIRFFTLSKFIIKRKVMRNGVRLRKIARK